MATNPGVAPTATGGPSTVGMATAGSGTTEGEVTGGATRLPAELDCPSLGAEPPVCSMAAVGSGDSEPIDEVAEAFTPDVSLAVDSADPLTAPVVELSPAALSAPESDRTKYVATPTIAAMTTTRPTASAAR
jgi:hypothetical protein